MSMERMESESSTSIASSRTVPRRTGCSAGSIATDRPPALPQGDRDRSGIDPAAVHLGEDLLVRGGAELHSRPRDLQGDSHIVQLERAEQSKLTGRRVAVRVRAIGVLDALEALPKSEELLAGPLHDPI